MPYSNIVFIKLFLELFDEDDRFLYQLNEKQQLLYIKMLYLAGRQKNKISKNHLLIIQKINYQGTAQDLLCDIKRIKKVFKNFQETKYFYTFTKFEELHNQIRVGLAQVKPEDSQRALPDKDKDKDKEEDKDKDYKGKIKLYRQIHSLLQTKLLKTDLSKAKSGKLWALIYQMKPESVMAVLERCQDKQKFEYYYQSLWRQSQDDLKTQGQGKIGDVLRQMSK